MKEQSERLGSQSSFKKVENEVTHGHEAEEEVI
jgi:hypothetical protein